MTRQREQPARRPATMKDIAEKAGVAQSTVSRILNDTPLLVPISPDTRDRVLAAAAELRYRPNPHARGLRGAPTMLVGAIVRDATDPFFAGAIEALSLEARHRGYSVVLGHARERADEALALAAILEARQCDALVVLGDMRTQPRLIEDLERVNVHVPVVAVWHGGRARGLPHGERRQPPRNHGRDAAPDEPRPPADRVRRRPGARRHPGAACRVPGLPRGAAAEGAARVRPARAQQLRRRRRRVRGADGAASAADRGRGRDRRARGRRPARRLRPRRPVPDEFSVVGFDDIPFAAVTVPALTTVRMPVEKMIQAAIGMAVDKRFRNAAGTAKGVRVFKPTLVVRRSTAPPARRARPQDLRG